MKLSEAASYGYVTILISKSPSIELLTDILEHERTIDIPTAAARGILPVEYTRLSRYDDVESIDNAVHSFYLELIRDLSKYLPNMYSRYLETFAEVYDIDRIAISLEIRSSKPLEYMFSRYGSLAQSLIGHRANLLHNDYKLCLESESIIECVYRVYLSRVVAILKTLSTPSLNNIALTDIRKSVDALHLFVLIRLYSYLMNVQKLKKERIVIDMFLEKYRFARHLRDIFSRVINGIEREIDRDVSFLIVYESRYVSRELKDMLIYSPTLLDRLTYLLIEKFYESKLVRYIAMKKYRW
ncbi:MAG: hypothetical protein QW101_00470 [Ignisphaera sp.]|uniref:Uncharacterized protein n=1 Tax=Ignisphaera aggregans TaxID=334771 RepID=A0A7J3MXB3_9CREN